MLPRIGRRGWLARLLLQLHNPLIHVLLAATAVALALGRATDAAVIFCVVVLNAVIGFTQETRAERALEALSGRLAGRATVVRGGRLRAIPAAEVVPGDLVALAAGEQVPADLRLVSVDGLRVDESSLTGESTPVSKTESAIRPGVEVAERANMAHSGTLVVGGSARGVATTTGGDTELGLVHRLLAEAEDIETPLTRQVGRMSRLLTAGIVALAAATYAAGLAHGGEPADLLIAAVALAVAAIPEGLPAALTITLALGVSRMARRRAIVRRLPAVETLGSTTVICTDKTGTLTRNEMTVEQIVAGGRRYDLSAGAISDGVAPVRPDAEPALRELLLAGVLCNDARLLPHPEGPRPVGDPTETALLVAAATGGIDEVVERGRKPRAAVLPFRSERALMATVNDGSIWVKGAPERVIPLCERMRVAAGGSEPLDHGAALSDAHELAAGGRRVLALARGDWGDGPVHDSDLRELTLLGVVAMTDPPREEAMTAVAACRRAGIEVKMVTGDHAVTAEGVAERIGLAGPRAITGAEIEALPDTELERLARSVSVFARVAPEHKLRLVRALQRQGEVVAMTGDGINDAPALRQADIGVAMGRGGTDVARESADIVLVDDNFASVEAAVEEGRHTFDNITKFLVWTLPTNIGEGLLVVVAIAAGAALPILPVQILWINLTTAVGLGLTLAVERAEPGIMRRPPRAPRTPLITRRLLEQMVLVGGLLLLASFALFEWERGRGSDIAEARTVAINAFVAIEVLYLFQCRSLHGAARRLGLFTNRWLIAGAATIVALQVLLTYAAPMQAVFQTAALGAGQWLRILAAASAAAVVIALVRRALTRDAPGPPPSPVARASWPVPAGFVKNPAGSGEASSTEPDVWETA